MSAPRICNLFFFDLSPFIIDTLDFDIPNNFEKYFMQVSFACPSTGGEDILTFKRPLCIPAISFFEERGRTVIEMIIPSLVFSIKESSFVMLFYLFKDLEPFLDLFFGLISLDFEHL